MKRFSSSLFSISEKKKKEKPRRKENPRTRRTFRGRTRGTWRSTRSASPPLPAAETSPAVLPLPAPDPALPAAETSPAVLPLPAPDPALPPVETSPALLPPPAAPGRHRHLPLSLRTPSRPRTRTPPRRAPPTATIAAGAIDVIGGAAESALTPKRGKQRSGKARERERERAVPRCHASHRDALLRRTPATAWKSPRRSAVLQTRMRRPAPEGLLPR